ncbi:MAG: YciI family protein [Caulobacteraceae bacterium]
MRFMIIRKADAETEASMMPTAELLTAMGDYIESMVKAGVMLAGDGLQASSKGARVKFHGGKPTVIDGPFGESKELVAGYSIINVASKAEAIEWVRKWPQLDGHGEVEIEIRQLHEAEDFGEAFTPEERQREERMRAEAANHSK